MQELELALARGMRAAVVEPGGGEEVEGCGEGGRGLLMLSIGADSWTLIKGDGDGGGGSGEVEGGEYGYE